MSKAKMPSEKGTVRGELFPNGKTIMHHRVSERRGEKILAFNGAEAKLAMRRKKPRT